MKDGTPWPLGCNAGFAKLESAASQGRRAVTDFANGIRRSAKAAHKKEESSMDNGNIWWRLRNGRGGGRVMASFAISAEGQNLIAIPADTQTSETAQKKGVAASGLVWLKVFGDSPGWNLEAAEMDEKQRGGVLRRDGTNNLVVMPIFGNGMQGELN
uniref:Uncharacterized protein n=1 Tax=Physcomitrium patens TaxID=3218 RepID=A0A2K1IA36_PHYPA|nr:hypothetical protein PHYPA_030715 [Physcomitrium patens]